MRVTLVNAFRPGGPKSWGQALAGALGPEAELRLVDSPARLPLLLAPADVVHTTVPFVRTRHPLVATVHGDFRREALVFRRPYESLLRRADVLTTTSTYMRDRLGLDGAHVIPGAIRDLGPLWRPYAGLGLRVLIAGNYAFEQKTRGATDLIDALAALPPARREGLTVDVAGGGAFEGQVRSAVARAGTGFAFLGWQDLRKLFATHDALLYNSYLDNQPMVLIEALLAGMPLRANPVADVPYMVPKEALMPDLGDLASALDELRDATARARESTRNRAWGLERFTWESIKPRWLALYRGLL